MRNPIKSLGLIALLALTSCNRSSDSIYFNQKNRPVKWYIVHEEMDKSSVLFDMDGDGNIDQVLKSNSCLRSGLGSIDGISRNSVKYFVSEETTSDKYCIGGITPQPLSPKHREDANGVLKLFH